MKIIITASGLGSRFSKKGIQIPKYLIKANEKTLLEYSILTLSNFFNYEFIFIFRELEDKNKIEEIIKNIKNHEGKKITKFHIVNLDKITKGQGETVLFAKKYFISDEDFMIFNIDTYVFDSHKFIKEEDIGEDVDGIIYTTKADGEHWSFAKTKNNSNKVIEVSEKKRISDNASIGLYYFKSFFEYCELVLKNRQQIIQIYNELYVMPIYKYLIEKGKYIINKNIPNKNFIPLGTPDEVYEFDKDFLMENKNV